MVAVMPDHSLLADPKHWRDRAEKTRTVAETEYNDEAKGRLLKIAMEYDRLAQYAETRVKEQAASCAQGGSRKP
jgi:hypothetical protein